MKQEYFNFDKFMTDIEDRQQAKLLELDKRRELESLSKTRELNKLYREHPLSKTYVGEEK